MARAPRAPRAMSPCFPSMAKTAPGKSPASMRSPRKLSSAVRGVVAFMRKAWRSSGPDGSDLTDGFEHQQRRFQCSPAVLAGDAGTRAAPARAEELLDLPLQGLVFLDREGVPPDGGTVALPFLQEPVLDHLLRIIEREVSACLPDPQLPDLLGADAAGGQVRDAARGEPNPRVGNVHLPGQGPDADRVHRDDAVAG